MPVHDVVARPRFRDARIEVQAVAASGAAVAPQAALHQLSPEAIEHVAQYFQVLSEPARLKLLRRAFALHETAMDVSSRCKSITRIFIEKSLVC